LYSYLIGEWVNEWNVADASQFQYQLFGKTQLEVYDEASFGWSYWTVKCNSVHWDYEWNIRNKYHIGEMFICATYPAAFKIQPFWKHGSLQLLELFILHSVNSLCTLLL
jgi:aryl-phospho-beta-D-glucosidase BglC (GH1 family)